MRIRTSGKLSLKKCSIGFKTVINTKKTLTQQHKNNQLFEQLIITVMSD